MLIRYPAMANTDPSTSKQIATRSVGEGLDFACNLLAGAMGRLADQRPEAASNILKTLAEYISYRYTGEDLLALEYLALLGRDLSGSAEVRWTQFWNQLEWVARQMDVSLESLGNAG
jgi:hypothetical protein